MNDYIGFDIEETYRFDKENNIFHCNLFYIMRKWNTYLSSHILKGERPDVKNSFDAMCHWTAECGLEDLAKLIDKDTKLVTHAGDWGIKCTQPHPDFGPMYGYALTSSDRHGKSVMLDIKSITRKFSQWFSANLKQDIGTGTYPVPIGIPIHQHEWRDADIDQLRSKRKTKLCYANFAITANSRIPIAEWINDLEYVNTYLYERRPDEGVDLRLPFLNKERLTMNRFIDELSSHAFAIAPVGNGIDTFRTWECILTNTIPIVQNTFCNKVFSKIWPMVLVDKYTHVDLLTKMSEFTDEHDDDKIDYDYTLLLKENFTKLLERIIYESDRLRRERT